MNLAEELMRVWMENHGLERGSPIVQAGADIANSFQPEGLDASDRVKILTTGFAILGVISKEIEGPLPKPVMEAVAHALTGAFGLGVRRGYGEALTTVAKEAGKLSKEFLSHKTGETLPSGAALQALEERAKAHHAAHSHAST